MIQKKLTQIWIVRKKKHTKNKAKETKDCFFFRVFSLTSKNDSSSLTLYRPFNA